MLHEDSMTRRIGRAAHGEHSLVVTDDLVAWVDSGYVLAYRDGAVDTVAGKQGESDLHTILAAHGERLYWTLQHDFATELFRFDGKVTASLFQYPTRESIISLRPNFRGLLVELAHNDGNRFQWFEAGSIRSMTLPGTAGHHLMEHLVSDSRIFGLVEIDPQWLESSHPCAGKRNPEGHRTFVFSESL